MDFRLDQDHLLIRNSVRELARQRIAPRAHDIDLSEQYPEDIFALFKEQGLFSLAVPEAEGGAGVGVLGLTVAVEEVAWACASSAKMLALTLFYTWPLLIAGTREQKDRFLAPAARGDLRGAFALTEPNAGADIGGLIARATSVPGGYVINGEKLYTSGGPQADYFIYFAKLGPQTEGTEPLTAFILPTASPHVFQLRQDRGIGVRGIPHPDFAVQDYTVDEGLRLGAERQGWEIAQRTLQVVQTVIAARGLGLAERCVSFAMDYTTTRKIYGGLLSDMDITRDRLGQIAAEIEGARLLTYQAAWLVDHMGDGPEIWPYLSAAKVISSQLAVKAAQTVMEVMGGHSYMTEHPVERWLRDSLQLLHYGLPNDVHRQTIAQALVDRRLTY